LVAGGAAESAEVLGRVRVERVVLARDRVHLGAAQAREQLLRLIELGGLGQVRDVAGVDDEGRLLRHRVDELDDLPQRAVDVGIGSLVKLDMVSLICRNRAFPRAVGPLPYEAAVARSFGVKIPPARVKRVPALP
jgi:hypothetical protein